MGLLWVNFDISSLPFIAFSEKPGEIHDLKELREACKSPLAAFAPFTPNSSRQDYWVYGGLNSQPSWLAEGLGLREDKGRPYTDLDRRCQAEITAQYILTSGEASLGRFGFPPNPKCIPSAKRNGKSGQICSKSLPRPRLTTPSGG